MKTQTCPVCKKDKDIEEFRRLTGLQNKFNKLCRGCIAPHKARYIPRPNTGTETHVKKGPYIRKYPKAKEGYKLCTKCIEEKAATLEFFDKNIKVKSGLGSWCRPCVSAYQIGRYVPRPKKSAKGKPVRMNKRPIPKEGYKICAGCKTEHPATLEFFHYSKVGKINLNSRCKKCQNEKNKKDRLNNLESYKLSAKKTQIKRRNKINAYYRERYASDPIFRMRAILGSRVTEAMEGNIAYSSKLGCSGPELKNHLAAKFQPGMSFDNWGSGPGKWQVDHIKCLKIAHMEGPESFLKACHFTNLQPLWHEDHLKKTKLDCEKIRQFKKSLI